jgi:hypothetical protein
MPSLPLRFPGVTSVRSTKTEVRLIVSHTDPLGQLRRRADGANRSRLQFDRATILSRSVHDVHARLERASTTRRPTRRIGAPRAERLNRDERSLAWKLRVLSWRRREVIDDRRIALVCRPDMSASFAEVVVDYRADAGIRQHFCLTIARHARLKAREELGAELFLIRNP